MEVNIEYESACSSTHSHLHLSPRMTLLKKSVSVPRSAIIACLIVSSQQLTRKEFEIFVTKQKTNYI